jgi:hypothetical protein
VTTVKAGIPTRRSSQALQGDRGVEWLLPRSTSVTMEHILIGPFPAIQTPSLPNTRSGSHQQYEPAGDGRIGAFANIS